VADARRSSMLDLHYHAHWTAERGEHGQGQDCHGKNGADLLIPAPVGTVVRNLATKETVADLVEDGQRCLAAKGGQGGRGNARFASSTNRAPRFAELGEPGEEAEYLLELKIIAEVGIIGLPNAGKSTLLAAISAARPKIDDYPFTTLSPNLGVARLSDFRTVTVADIPGLIEGAAEGKGLGHDFLRHIERTKVLLFLIDLGDPDPVKTRDILENELTKYSPVFVDRPRVFALNKADIPANRGRFDSLAGAFDHPFVTSAVTGEGIPPLLEHLWQMVDRLRSEDIKTAIPLPEREYTYEPPYTIEKTPQGFRIEGKRVLQAVRMTNFENEYAVRHLHHTLQKMGVFKALKRMGAEAGQTIAIGDTELEYHPD
jgi:GTP-binding protein